MSICGCDSMALGDHEISYLQMVEATFEIVPDWTASTCAVASL